MIVGFNVVLKMVVIYAMSKVGYKTISEEIIRITLVTWLCYFFNSGFMVMLVNADMSEQPLLGSLFNGGKVSDFNSRFF